MTHTGVKKILNDGPLSLLARSDLGRRIRLKVTRNGQHYSSLIRWHLRRGLDWSVDARRRGEYSELKEAVAACLTVVGPAISYESAENLAELVSDLRDGDSTRHEDASSQAIMVCNEITNRAPSITPEQWLAIREILATHGLFQASHYFKHAARTSALQRENIQTSQSYERIEQIRALIDSGDITAAQDCCGKFVWQVTDAPTPEEFVHYLSALQGTGAVLRDITEFSNFIQGKHVALVGPAGKESFGDLIDNHDVVVRLTYWGPEFEPTSSLIGSRVDVSYYGKKNGDRLLSEVHSSVLDRLRFARFRDLPRGLNHPNTSSAFRLDPLFFGGIPMLGTAALVDLLVNRAKLVSVFGINFMIAEKPYFASYAGGRHQIARPNGFKCLSYARHDFLEQLVPFKVAIRAGLCEMNGTGADVLKLDPLELLRSADLRYGIDWR